MKDVGAGLVCRVISRRESPRGGTRLPTPETEPKRCLQLRRGGHLLRGEESRSIAHLSVFHAGPRHPEELGGDRHHRRLRSEGMRRPSGQRVIPCLPLRVLGHRDARGLIQHGARRPRLAICVGPWWCPELVWVRFSPAIFCAWRGSVNRDKSPNSPDKVARTCGPNPGMVNNGAAGARAAKIVVCSASIAICAASAARQLRR